MTGGTNGDDVSTNVRHIHLSYNPADSYTSALRLILTLFPDWEHAEGNVEFVRFTDGITNTVCMPPLPEISLAVPITSTEVSSRSF